MANGYKKLAGGARPGRLAVTTMSLWQGPDHLLQIERDGYAENYRRFYFADIEIFTVRLDNRRRNIAIIFGIVVAAMVLLAVLLNAGGGSIFFLCCAGFFMIPFIYNLVRGPTCVVHVTTAVQREELQSVRRLKGALRLLQAIRDHAAQTQGVLAPDMVRVKFELENAPVGYVPPPPPTVSESAPIPFSMETAPAVQPTESAPAEPASTPTPPAAEPPPSSQ
jgi:hypothetical protein